VLSHPTSAPCQGGFILVSIHLNIGTERSAAVPGGEAKSLDYDANRQSAGVGWPKRPFIAAFLVSHSCFDQNLAIESWRTSSRFSDHYKTSGHEKGVSSALSLSS